VLTLPIAVALLAGPPATVASPPPEPPLVAAARKGDTAQARGLVARGADVNARDASGRSALLIAVAGDHADVAQLLVRAGADVNAPTPSGWTPLMDAASRGRIEAARELLDAGADPDARDRFAGTALDVAQQAGREEIVRLLRERGGRGSGRSEGDTVCSRRWKGQGFCGVVLKAEATRYRLRVTRLAGCAAGCAADEDCSAGRAIGGPGGVAVGDVLWIRSWCLTDTQVEAR
jgi:hypothetical protein